jgi:hypothetical protein
MNTNDNFDSLWSNLRASIVEARTTTPQRLKVVATSPMPTVIDHTDIEVSNDSIQMHRAGSLMRCYLTKEDALKLAANLITIHTNDLP